MLMRDILESVVTDGSGSNAYIPGYRVGGKTGTAQKYDADGKIMTGRHIASFMGFAPANDPQIAVLIIVDEPNVAVDFGSVVAAPYVKNVLFESLLYMGIAPDYGDAAPPVQVSVPGVFGKTLSEAIEELEAAGFKYIANGTGTVTSQLPAPGIEVDKGTTVLLYMSDQQQTVDMTGKVVVPDLSGLTIMQASQLLDGSKLRLGITGEGKAVFQNPAAGDIVDEGTEIMVEFSTRGAP